MKFELFFNFLIFMKFAQDLNSRSVFSYLDSIFMNIKIEFW
jgi:hypothetical protein